MDSQDDASQAGGSQLGDDGSQLGDDGSQLGDDGSQLGDDGSQLGEGSQADAGELVDLTQDDSQVDAPKAPKKKPEATFAGRLPLSFGSGAAREGKATLLVELDGRAGGFGVDTGAIGRASFPKVDGKRAFRLDLRGQEYAATIRPCPTMLVLNVAGGEAKVESIVSEYVTLKHTRDATRDDAIIDGDYDAGYGTYAGDVDVNRKGRKRSPRPGDGSDSDSGSDVVEVPKKKRKPAPKKKAAAGRGKK